MLRTSLVLALPSLLAAQRPASPPAPLRSAPITDVRYDVRFDAATAHRRTIAVEMRFAVASAEPVLLSMPAWTPGAYEISNFARYVSAFAAKGDAGALEWDKADFDTWRVRPTGRGTVTVAFDVFADSLDNAMSWSRPNFALFNGTNVFLYPEGRDAGFPSTVKVRTEAGWRVATGMARGADATTFTAPNYHDLVDMPFFVGVFDLDSVRVSDRQVYVATYPEGAVNTRTRSAILGQLAKVIPPSVAVFRDTPFDRYVLLQIVDSAFGGGSGLEHQNSHVDILSPLGVGSAGFASLYAHEILHAWNVKRLRPADHVPYRYDAPQPTPWLWVSEGITDYYADLVMVRGGVMGAEEFYGTTTGKVQHVDRTAVISLEDASLNAWISSIDGTSDIYYDKGSLAGLMLDIMIRDASDNRRSLDDVMHELYDATGRKGQGFTREQWWGAVSRAAGGRSFADFERRYVDGRDPYPWDAVLPLAGMRLASDTVREPRMGVLTLADSGGVQVTGVDAGSVAEAAGLRTGDYIVSVGEVPVTDLAWGARYRARYAKSEGAVIPIVVRRAGATVTLSATVRLGQRVSRGVRPDEAASTRAVRIRNGILTGTVDR